MFYKTCSHGLGTLIDFNWINQASCEQTLANKWLYYWCVNNKWLITTHSELWKDTIKKQFQKILNTTQYSSIQQKHQINGVKNALLDSRCCTTGTPLALFWSPVLSQNVLWKSWNRGYFIHVKVIKSFLKTNY